MSKPTKAEQAEATERLRELLPPGTTVYTILKRVSASGMSRIIQPFVVKDGAPYDLTYLVAKAGLFNRSTDSQPEGLKVGGAGMDMGFHLVYGLSRVVHRDTFKCIGDGRKGGTRCPSNDHSNDYGDFQRQGKEQGLEGAALRDFIDQKFATSYSKRRKHSDGGYALKQSWF